MALVAHPSHMIIQSYARQGHRLDTIQVEIQLLPGLPQLQIIGLPDTGIKESILRIKSAIKSQGFQWPNAQQIVVNLRPSYQKKTSEGLELAIALGYLLLTKQIRKPKWFSEQAIIYGGLHLDGTVQTPHDLNWHPENQNQILVTGISSTNIRNVVLLNELKDFSTSEVQEIQSDWRDSLERPNLQKSFTSPELAELMVVSTLGRFSTLLLGAPGTGKTTLAEQLYALTSPPDEETFLWAKALWTQEAQELKWRPWVQPHHSGSKLGLLGGGVPLRLGEISRAHGGVLFLDEFLEFDREAVEGLREPLEKKCIRLARVGRTEKFPADFQLIAATNLCPCGKRTIDFKPSCHYTVMRCRSTIQKLSGPLLDRFELVMFTDVQSSQRTVNLLELRNQMDEKVRECPLSKWQGFDEDVPPTFEKVLMGLSERRRLTMLRVARVLAYWRGVHRLSFEDWQKVYDWTITPLNQIQKLLA